MALLAAACLFAACSRGARAVRLPSANPGDELYRITCKNRIEPCREKAAALCGEYVVLQSSGTSSEPPRVSSAPGPRSTGSRYQRPDWVGELLVACGSEPAPPVLDGVAPATAAPATPGQLCIPGVTQACLGPAACRGAQACLADGLGYGPCDCGEARSSPADAGAFRE